MNRKYVRRRGFHISAWDLKRQYKFCNFGLKADIRWSPKQTCQLHRECSLTVTLLHKKGHPHSRKIYANSFWLYSWSTQTSFSKNKNINYIFIYIWVLRFRSSGSIYDICIPCSFAIISSRINWHNVLLCTPSHGRAKAGWLVWTYIQLLCADTGCCPEDLPEAMNDWEEWRERVRDIRADGVTWWWWWSLFLCRSFILQI